jgi:hypothetical protein
MQDLSNWLTESYLNTVFSDTTHLETRLIIPVSQSLHILAVAFVAIAVGVLNLRLLGVAGTRHSFADLSTQLIPWIWSALIVLFVTGAVQTIAEPSRELMNVTFRTKMLLLLITVGITVFYQIQVKKNPKYWDQRRELSWLLASVSLALWVGIVAAGRLIAYMGAIETF